MKQFNAVKLLVILALLSAANVSKGQIHPLAFSTGTNTNWYASYVGLRFEVTSPAAIAGDKQYTAAYSGASPWGGAVTAPIVNVPIIMDSTADSFGCSPFTISMAGKIAVIWRGPAASACEFGYKALQAQSKGAVAVVLINEYSGEGPIGMAAGASGGSVTIPVFMIGNLDGVAISGQYRSGVPVTMTITPWGLNNQRDLGFVPSGAAGWHAYAVPKDQIPAGVATPAPYKCLDGGFIANYGSSDAINVSIAGSLNYTPDATGITVNLHKDTLTGEATFYGSAHSPAGDSIIAMFTAPEYGFAPATTGTGRYDLKYTIFSDSVDQYPPDNTITNSFYTTDSVYSKGRYDFANKGPISTMFEGAGGTPAPDYVWGNMYYVAHGRDAVRTLQFSLYNQSGVLGAIAAGQMELYVFKWVDGSNGQPADSVIENGELQVVSMGQYTFKPSDTSGMVFTLPYMVDPVTGNPGDHAPWLDSNSWYYVAAEVPGGYFLGCDGGNISAYPRVYGRLHSTGYLENANFEWSGDYTTGANTMTSQPNIANFPLAFPEVNTISVDSFNYASQKGLIPSIAMIITTTPDTSHLHDGVGNISKPYADIKLYPNPATDYISVSVTLPATASKVTYTILDGLGRFVCKQTHYDIASENFNIPTSNLAAGNYFLIVSANDKMESRKFTVIK